jgi:putative ABC transport system substrate-binding protein
MNRREFITLMGGAAASSSVFWPLAALAQQRADRMRRVGVLLGLAESDPEAQDRISVFRQHLQRLGWTEGRDVQLDYRFGADDLRRIQTYAAELVSIAPDVIFINSQPVLDAVRKATRTIPIVFTQVTDPVGNGLVASLARPGGNLTGFANFESIGGKLLELLREIAPSVTNVAVILNPENASNVAQFHVIRAAAQSSNVQLSKAEVQNTADIVQFVDAFASQPNSGLIVLASPTTNANRELIISLTVRHRLPAIYPFRYFVTNGGLISYGLDNRDIVRRAASYVDRILKGANPGELPVEMPTRFELVINLKTAKTLGLDVPWFLQQRADEVIE